MNTFVFSYFFLGLLSAAIKKNASTNNMMFTTIRTHLLPWLAGHTQRSKPQTHRRITEDVRKSGRVDPILEKRLQTFGQGIVVSFLPYRRHLLLLPSHTAIVQGCLALVVQVYVVWT